MGPHLPTSYISADPMISRIAFDLGINSHSKASGCLSGERHPESVTSECVSIPIHKPKQPSNIVACGFNGQVITADSFFNVERCEDVASRYPSERIGNPPSWATTHPSIIIFVCVPKKKTNHILRP